MPDENDESTDANTDTGDGEEDDDTLLGSDDAGDGDDAGEGEHDGDEPNRELMSQVESMLDEKLKDATERIADRTVNATLKRIRRQQDDDKSKAKGKDESESSSEPLPDVRATRMAFKEYLGDEFKPISNEERQFANEYGQALIAQRIEPGADEDKLGREVASSVAAQVTSLRKHYERQTKAALKRKGLLLDKAKEGQPGRGPASIGAGSEWEKGKKMAEERFKDRTPAA
jgi:hypothetical protein